MAQSGQPYRQVPGSASGVKDAHRLISQCRDIIVQHAPEDSEPDGAPGGAVDVGFELVSDPIEADITRHGSPHVPHVDHRSV